MKITYVEVIGLNGSKTPVKLKFNEDLNIITGRNGAGKTTILKLIWYVISGNIELALREVNFESFLIDTDIYSCYIYKIDNVTCKVRWKWIEQDQFEFFEDVFKQSSKDDREIVQSAEDIPNQRLIESGSSIFLPTFRRIEGGFLTKSRLNNLSGRIIYSSKNSPINEALNNISGHLSNNNHIFVSSLSTNDVERLLLDKYAELTERFSNIQQQETQETLNKIQRATAEDAITLLNEVKSQMENLELQRQQTMQPFETFKEQVLTFIKLNGIRLGDKKDSLSLGDSASAISSDSLSSGEKQLLSFLAYNAFLQNTIFIIDEPELSLHVDWQRQLFPTLMKQGSTNQFIVATHSPFIYSKYPDKELPIAEDRGDNEALA